MFPAEGVERTGGERTVNANGVAKSTSNEEHKEHDEVGCGPTELASKLKKGPAAADGRFVEF